MAEKECFGGYILLDNPTIKQLKEGIQHVEAQIEKQKKDYVLDMTTLRTHVRGNERGNIGISWKIKGERRLGNDQDQAK